MKSRAERLRVLIQDDGGDGSYYVVNQIIALFKECVPDHKRSMNGKFCECFAFHKSECGCGADWSDFSEWNNCRTETLKNIEELGK